MTNPLAQDLGGVVLLPCPFCGAENAEVQKWLWWVQCNECDSNGPAKATEAEAITAWNTRAHSAEIAGALEQLRDLHDSIRTVYDAVPALPITADTMDAATNALHAFCLLVGIHRVDVGDPQPKPAMQQGPGEGEIDFRVTNFIMSQDLYSLLTDIQNGIDSPAMMGTANSIIHRLDRVRDLLTAPQVEAKRQTGEGLTELDRSIINEAAEVLEAVGVSGVPLPANWRWPLADELSGIAAAAKPSGKGSPNA